MKISIHRAYANFEDGYLFTSDEWDEFIDSGEFAGRGEALWMMMSQNPGNWVISCQPEGEYEKLENRWDYGLIAKMLEERAFPQERGELFDFFVLMHAGFDATSEGCVKIAWGLDIGEGWVDAAEFAADFDIEVSSENTYNDAQRTAARMYMDYNNVSAWVQNYVDLEASFEGEDELHVFEYAGSYWAIHDRR